eukprot:scaffold1803_cov195-Alexandrium_tamarense.AAC.6
MKLLLTGCMLAILIQPKADALCTASKRKCRKQRNKKKSKQPSLSPAIPSPTAPPKEVISKECVNHYYGMPVSCVIMCTKTINIYAGGSDRGCCAREATAQRKQWY